MIGFSILHIHPLFAIGGMFCSTILVLWLAVAGIFAALNRFKLARSEWWMALGAAFVVLAMFMPDDSGLAFR